MNRRDLMKGAMAIPLAAALPCVASGAPVAMLAFGLDVASARDKTWVQVCEMSADGLWRVISTGELVPGNDVDTYMSQVIEAAKAA